MWAAPRRHVAWGVIVILSSVPSLLISGGLLGVLFPVGFMLSLIGGILAIQWKPTPEGDLAKHAAATGTPNKR